MRRAFAQGDAAWLVTARTSATFGRARGRKRLCQASGSRRAGGKALEGLSHQRERWDQPGLAGHPRGVLGDRSRTPCRSRQGKSAPITQYSSHKKGEVFSPESPGETLHLIGSPTAAQRARGPRTAPNVSLIGIVWSPGRTQLCHGMLPSAIGWRVQSIGRDG